ncbi:MAG: hypothetical protein ACFCUE_04405 [Candidatus Bathyarchaeia archaeon]|jgi:DNA-binding PadR family transcriptional regulator
MPKRSSELNVFKGQEKRLNLAIFLVLSISGPLPERVIRKQVEEFGWVYDGSLYKRLQRLVTDSYLKTLPPLEGSKAKRYDITHKARLAMFLETFDKQTLIEQANDKDGSSLLATIKIIVSRLDSNPDLLLQNRILHSLKQ